MSSLDRLINSRTKSNEQRFVFRFYNLPSFLLSFFPSFPLFVLFVMYSDRRCDAQYKLLLSSGGDCRCRCGFSNGDVGNLIFPSSFLFGFDVDFF